MTDRTPAHGTPARYFHRGCRCDDCKKAGSEYMRDYRAGRKANGGRYVHYCVDCGSDRVSTRLVGGLQKDPK